MKSRSSSSKVRPTLLRKMNERRVLEVIQTRGPSSRADVTRYSGISAPTVSKAVASLLKDQLLEETDLDHNTQGRPGKLLRLASETVQVLGAVIGIKQCWVVSAGLDGQLSDDYMRSFSTPASYKGLLDKLQQSAEDLASQRDVPVLGVGISIPGLLNNREERTLLSPNIPQTNGRALGKDLSQRLGMPTEMLQESHALCLSERTYGAARGVDHFVMIDISDGLGVGIMSGGQLLVGQSGMAGEFGHITVVADGLPCGCGNHGCLETVACDAALAKAVSKRLKRSIDIEELVAGVQSREIDATEEINHASEYLAIGVAALINIFNPGVVFVNGRFFDAAEGIFERVVERAGERALAPSVAECRIIRARGSKRQGAVAAVISHLTTARGPALAEM